jgi:hypothetical protein
VTELRVQGVRRFAKAGDGQGVEGSRAAADRWWATVEEGGAARHHGVVPTTGDDSGRTGRRWRHGSWCLGEEEDMR